MVTILKLAHCCKPARLATMASAMALAASVTQLPGFPSDKGLGNEAPRFVRVSDSCEELSLGVKSPWDLDGPRIKLPAKSRDDIWFGLKTSIAPNERSSIRSDSDDEKARRALELRQQYPFFSVLNRLTKLRRAPTGAEQSAEAIQEIDYVHGYERYHRLTTRSLSLEALHSSEVESFIQSEGFGWVRNQGMVPAPDHLYLEESSPIEQIAASPPSAASVVPRELLNNGWSPPLPSEEGLAHLARESQLLFTAPQTLGYVRTLNQVAGFQSHAFRMRPKLRELPRIWRVSRLELISLLTHHEPVVYVSKYLPRMQELAQNPVTRPVDPFERNSIGKLNVGKQIVYNASLNRIEMVGAIRAVTQCTKCHNADAGALLGAFSYTIDRDPPISLPAGETLAAQ
jgi:hypothetical protein